MTEAKALSQANKEVRSDGGTRYILRKGEKFLISKWPRRHGWESYANISQPPTPQQKGN